MSDPKQQLRQKMLSKRAKLHKQLKADYDESICQLLWMRIRQQDCQTVHCYLPMGMEIDITPLISKLLAGGLTVVAPKTLPKRKLQHLVLHDLNKLEKGVFGTSHPAGNEEFLGKYDLIIVPGLAFDKAHYRLGYGGGYYDHFLSCHPYACKLGICYPFQLLETVPVETHDVMLDEVLVHSEFFGHL